MGRTLYQLSAIYLAGGDLECYDMALFARVSRTQKGVAEGWLACASFRSLIGIPIVLVMSVE